ncbi:hypothetical protein BSLG_001910 [Batrachochytrium salamandrivorans]|nr:hypothetical protein BSLG_001910 [Batrachochytrium salamandrivorans]
MVPCGEHVSYDAVLSRRAREGSSLRLRVGEDVPVSKKTITVLVIFLFLEADGVVAAFKAYKVGLAFNPDVPLNSSRVGKDVLAPKGNGIFVLVLEADEVVLVTKAAKVGFVTKADEVGFVPEATEVGFVTKAAEVGFVPEATEVGFVTKAAEGVGIATGGPARTELEYV